MAISREGTAPFPTLHLNPHLLDSQEHPGTLQVSQNSTAGSCHAHGTTLCCSPTAPQTPLGAQPYVRSAWAAQGARG